MGWLTPSSVAFSLFPACVREICRGWFKDSVNVLANSSVPCHDIGRSYVLNHWLGVCILSGKLCTVASITAVLVVSYSVSYHRGIYSTFSMSKSTAKSRTASILDSLKTLFNYLSFDKVILKISLVFKAEKIKGHVN